MGVIHDNKGQAVGEYNPLNVRSVQSKWRAGFTGTQLNPDKWDIVQVGEGQTISVVGGELNVNMGIVPLAETIIRSKQLFDIPMRTMAHLIMSQRIANNEVFLELVSVDEVTGEPNGHSMAAWEISGITTTTGFYAVNGGDQPLLRSAAVTITSPATAGAIFEIEPTADECWFYTRTPDSAVARATAYVRNIQIPDPNLMYKFQIRIRNGVVAPATNTLVRSQFIGINDYAEITAEITAGRGNTNAGQAISTIPAGGSIATLTTAYVSPKSIFNSETVANIAAGATFTGTARDNSATSLYGWYRLRIFADQPLRIDVRCGASATVTLNRVQEVINVPANTVVVKDIPICARYIAIQATNTSGLATTAVEILSTQLGTL